MNKTEIRKAELIRGIKRFDFSEVPSKKSNEILLKDNKDGRYYYSLRGRFICTFVRIFETDSFRPCRIENINKF
jgi:hypothetical protein